MSAPPLSLLFSVFFKAGASTFGGGPAIIAVLETECASHHKLLSVDEFVEDVALATVIPGAICVNLAFLIGYRLRGIVGSLASAFGVIIAPFFVISIILQCFSDILQSPLFGVFLKGAASAVTGLIVVAAWSLGRSLLKTYWQYFATGLFVLLVGSKLLSPLQGVVAILVLDLLYFYIPWVRPCDDDTEDDDSDSLKSPAGGI
jgi:chromate transporter